MKLKAIILSLLISTSANAAPYVGLELQNNQLDFNSSSFEGIRLEANDYYGNNNTNLGFILGYELEKTPIAIQLTYSKINTEKENNNTGLVTVPANQVIKTKTIANYDNLDLDVIASQKLSKGFSILGLIGVKVIKAETNEYYNVLQNKYSSEIGYGLNLGTGFKFTANKHIDLVVKGKYSVIQGLEGEGLNGHKGLKRMITFSTGLIYKF